MMGKTHLTVGIATAMLVVRPSTKVEFITAIIGGALGGVLPDIDVKIDRSNKYSKKASMDALYSEIAVSILIFSLAVIDYSSNFAILHSITENGYIPAIGIVCFLVLFIFGEKSRHRDKTHSILFMILFALSICLVSVPIGVATAVGYLSHLTLDLLNKSPERLFYPLKRGICFKICYAEGMGNELLFSVGLSVLMGIILLQIA